MLTEGKIIRNSLPEKDLKTKIERILLEVNKPSRYIGQEIGAANKNWDSALVKTAIVFPDLYEIGISNLGLRILYHIINNRMSEEFLADRAFAPDQDFKQKLAEHQIPLYGLESYKPLNEFDVLAFSLQYELSYPTILAMLEMSHVPIKSHERDNNHPIIIAGGPGSYNPESLTDFIDAFIIGDGEEALPDILEEIKRSKLNNASRIDILKNLSQINGVYVPVFYEAQDDFSRPRPINAEFPEKISKKISTLDDKNHPVNFPVPYISTVHDRAVIEIRRGCGRMCRFCQSCFINLPVRERSAESIVNIAEQVLENTGYDEYSLLSLSSNDYQNIEELVCELNRKHAGSGASISLPSQRADSFSIELANLVQSVRKSTLTFAPEAGSQRLRDVINKNLDESQIVKAVLSAYEAGWNSVKLYFMISLPTETFQDLDEIINLLRKIKDKAKELKQAQIKNKHLDITCTISIFVPKPFTPFQWCGQDSLELINEKIRYLREKARSLKGVKLNFHDSFLSQIEAVFARGDRRLNRLIELVYRKGSYLDAWTEHFNKQIWYESANELNLEFHAYSSKKIKLDTELPWDIIDIGVDKNWLITEYIKANKEEKSTPCDDGCIDCGVCKAFKTKPDIKSKMPPQGTGSDLGSANISGNSYVSENDQNKNTFRYRLNLKKSGHLKYISHLDWQRMLYRAIRKSEIKISFTKGFNPSPKISIGLALPLFIESIQEFADIEIEEEMQEDILLEKLNKFLPESSKILKIITVSKSEPVIDLTVKWAKYSAVPVETTELKKDEIKEIIEDFLTKEEILVEKQNFKKRKKKVINIKPLVNSLIMPESKDDYRLEFVLKVGQGSDQPVNSDADTVATVATIRPDEFLKSLFPQIKWNIIRESLLNSSFKELV